MNHAKTDPYVFLSIGKIFWVEKKYNKARKFFQRATELGRDNGDTWLHLLAFEKALGDQVSVERVLNDFIKANPRHGELWEAEVKKVSNWRRSKIDIINSMQVTLPNY